MFDYDLVVIGSGPAGQRAAIQAAKLEKSVLLVERQQVVGGICVNNGTVPSKTLREAIVYLTGYREHGYYGQSYRVKPKITMADLQFRITRVVEHEIDVIRNQMNRNGVEMVIGTARFVDAHTIVLDSPEGFRQVTGEFVVIATGTEASMPNPGEIDDIHIFVPDTFLTISEIPRSLVVIGGGVIGLEYASMFAELGVRVTVVESRSTVLEFVDREIVEHLTYRLRNNRAVLRLGETVTSLGFENDSVSVHLKSGKHIVGEYALYSVGRNGATSKLNLSSVGLTPDPRGRLKVNEHYQTEVPHIYAVGDVIGYPSLASTGREQGRVAAGHAFGVPISERHGIFPYGIYTLPEISFVGATEQELTNSDVPYEVGVSSYGEITRGQILGDLNGRLKLIFHRESMKLLGVHIIGEGAAELIHIGQAVLAFGGGIDYFIETVVNYPTLAECYKVAAFDGLNRIGRYY